MRYEPIQVADSPSYMYTVYVENIGDADAGMSYVELIVDPPQPQSINSGSYYKCTDGHSAPVPQNDLVSGEVLEPGQMERNYDYFNPVYPGNVTITAIADRYNQVTESNEDNNELTVTFSIDSTVIDIDSCPEGCIENAC